MKWIKKVFSKINEEPEKTGIELPSLNWFIHTLINNVGFFKWVKKSREEQIEYDKEHPYDAGYPYKAVKYPIPH